MIKEQFLYFARYPAKSGIRAILTNGSSDFPGYADLLSALDALPEQSRVPEINNYVYGQSFEELQQRISRLVGSFLFVDYGEFDMSGDKSHSFRLTQRMAITVAFKMPESRCRGIYVSVRHHASPALKSACRAFGRCRSGRCRVALPQ
ncbi:hypothetical protein [Hoylesella saccharolytica]|uniref:hypothetical protein n=1 Tax=Hoylesella saccharolytica TaxID=633701 RepID=UPI000A950B69|nr:hypothetical protein [Hoylesella saccharolytica]